MKTIFVILLMSFACFANDGKIDQLYDQVGDEVREQLVTGLASLEDMNAADPSQRDWLLKRFMLRIQAMFGFEVPFLASLRVVPEVEIIAERK